MPKMVQPSVLSLADPAKIGVIGPLHRNHNNKINRRNNQPLTIWKLSTRRMGFVYRVEAIPSAKVRPITFRR
jgi:hypothetical protein